MPQTGLVYVLKNIMCDICEIKWLWLLDVPKFATLTLKDIISENALRNGVKGSLTVTVAA